MLVATLKDMTEQPDGASLKKVGMAERNARMEKLNLQLRGVAIVGPLEPSQGLLDAPCNSGTLGPSNTLDLRNVTAEKRKFRTSNRQLLQLAWKVAN